MTDFFRAQATFGHKIAGGPGASIDFDDPRLLGLSGVLLPSVWPFLTEAERGLEAAEGFGVAHSLNRDRNDALVEQLAAVVVCLNGIGVEPVLLKGAAHLVSGLWPDSGARLLGDIDLLVPVDRVGDCFAALEELAGVGSQDAGDSDLTDLHKHALPVQGAGGAFPVELHHSIFRTAYRKVVPSDAVIARSEAVSVGAGQARMPAVGDQVLIAMLHGLLGGGGYLAPVVQMRDLLDIVFLADRHGAEIDWSQIETQLSGHRWAVGVEITRRCLAEFTGFDVPFGPVGLVAGADATRWRWQLERRWAQRAGQFANLSQETVTSIAAGGAPRRRALGYLAQADTYKRAWRRYVQGEARQ